MKSLRTKTDHELIHLFRDGDLHALEALILRHKDKLYTSILFLVKDKYLAEDIFQDTMMALYERLPQFRREAPLGAWLRQIALNRCLMYLRSPWQRARMRLEVSELAGGCGSNMLVVPGQRGESIDLERALAALAPTARAVVWMFEVEGYSHEEIARAFGRSVSFSKSQLARAHVRLRAWLEPQEIRPSCTVI